MESFSGPLLLEMSEGKALPISVRLPAQNIVLNFTFVPSSKVATLYETVVERLVLTREHYYLTLEDDTPLNSASTLGDLKENKGIFYVRVNPDAPVISRMMFMTPAELKKLSRNWGTEELAAVDIHKRNALHTSAQYSHDNLKAVLKKKKIDVNAADLFGNTPLMYAARSGDLSRVNLLLSAGATGDVRNKQGETALHFLCKNPSVTEQEAREIIQLLATQGVHAFCRDKVGNTPAHIAVLNNNLFCLAQFVSTQFYQLESKNGDGDTCLHLAVRSQDPGRVAKLLEMGAPKYILNNAGELPLDIAHDLRLPQTIVLLNADLETKTMTRVCRLSKRTAWRCAR